MVRGRFELDRLTGAPATIGGDEELRAGILDAFLQRRVLLAQLFDVRKAGANPFVR